jgi:hypothetical protein
MNDLDDLITRGLRHRADTHPASPRGLADVHRRISRRRRRTATAGAFAVLLPAAVGLVFLANRSATHTSAGSPATSATALQATTATTIPAAGRPAGGVVTHGYRCAGDPIARDDNYTYYDVCEPTPPDMATTTTLDPSPSILIVDASGIPGAVDQVIAALGSITYPVTLIVVSGQTSPRTMVMPMIPDSPASADIATILDIGGFDTWSGTTWTDAWISPGAVAAVIIGQDYASHLPATPTVSDSGCPEGEYTIVAGDYPSTIAKKFDLNLDDLRVINNWTIDQSFAQLVAGTVIKIPARTSPCRAGASPTTTG